MNSIIIKDFEATLEKFINDYKLPWEVKRLVLKNLYEEATVKTNAELLSQAQERESKKE